LRTPGLKTLIVIKLLEKAELLPKGITSYSIEELTPYVLSTNYMLLGNYRQRDSKFQFNPSKKIIVTTFGLVKVRLKYRLAFRNIRKVPMRNIFIIISLWYILNYITLAVFLDSRQSRTRDTTLCL
jgi:hypothetical protein